jgi:hypothetical protein
VRASLPAPPVPRRPTTLPSAPTLAVVCGAGLIALLGGAKLGVVGLALPLALLLGVALLRYPGAMMVTAVAAVIAAEGSDFGLFPQTTNLYADLMKGFTPLDAIFTIAVAGTVFQVIQDRRRLRTPPPILGFALILLGLGIISGILVGRQAGQGVADSILVVHSFVYLALLPMIVVNLRFDDRQVVRVLGGMVALGVVKAVLGVVVVTLGKGEVVDGSTPLTYYEPTANWLMTVGVLCIVAAFVMRVRVPWWVLASAPVMLLSLTLSYRRSFWIADCLGLVLVVLLGLRPKARRLLIPSVALVAVAFWLLGGVALQSDTPLGQRVSSLSSSKIDAKPDDRYRIDERTNVVAAIKREPVTGLGLNVPWHANAAPLPVEANPTHQYVHFAFLYWWLKLGILGACAYVALLLAVAVLSWRVWHGSPTPVLRAFGLGSLCSVIGLVVIESTTTFTGVDPRFTVLFAGQFSLLAVLAQRAGTAGPPPAQPLARSDSTVLV